MNLEQQNLTLDNLLREKNLTPEQIARARALARSTQTEEETQIEPLEPHEPLQTMIAERGIPLDTMAEVVGMEYELLEILAGSRAISRIDAERLAANFFTSQSNCFYKFCAQNKKSAFTVFAQKFY